MQSAAEIRPRSIPSRRRRDGLIRFAADYTSQNGEDGIIARIFQLLPPSGRRLCVDVGAWDGVHLSNTCSLLFPKGDDPVWRGILIEADPEKFSLLSIQHAETENLVLNISISVESHDSPSNLYCVLEKQDIFVNGGQIDFLCIDIDGSDYYVLHDLLLYSQFRPVVICIEFNPTMPDDMIYIPPRSDSIRHGASLAALVELASTHDYMLVETTLYNAFFVRAREYEQYLLSEVPDTSIEALHETTMGTSLYQLYDGTLKLWGCKRLLWHRIPMDEVRLQILPQEQRIFPFAPSTNTEQPSFDTSQVVDMSPYCQSVACIEQRAFCASSLYAQLQTNGFALIRGTGMDQSLCQQALEATKDLLQDADETVRRSCLASDRARRGYSPMNAENFASLLGQQGPNDLVRKFRVGPSSGSSTVDNASTSSALLQENIWPSMEQWEKACAFQSTVESYYEAACIAAKEVVRAICDGLIQAHPELQTSLQPLVGANEHSTSILTLLGYRSGTRHKGKNKGPLVASHTDVGVITMLLFDGGTRTCAQLQRSDGKGGWVDVALPSVVPVDPIFVINVADCLSDLCRQYLPSTLHRVVARPESTIPRNCCALFVGLDSAAPLTLESGEIISYEEWRKRRIAKAQTVLRLIPLTGTRV